VGLINTGPRADAVRLAALDTRVLLIFGTDDRRWRSVSAQAYDVQNARVERLSGVGHTPMSSTADHQ
jgi:pimeloyl-ACP methyl ester carboxylesterase